jgi:pimeloyl-ACP methyl ester carboxylesterase
MRMIRRWPWVLAAILLTTCATVPPKLSEQQAEPPLRSNLTAFHAAWDAYAAETNELDLQTDCRPRAIPAEPGMPRRGAVVMVHGYWACPQQFFELAPLLTARGFDVLLPLLPGHGAHFDADQADQLTGLPGLDDWESAYGGLAQRINAIMALSPGERVIVGFSAGGAVSVNANLRASKLYDRHLLLSPFFGTGGGATGDAAIEFLGRVPGLKNLRFSNLGVLDRCYELRVNGTARLCDFHLEHVAGLLALAKQNLRAVDELGLDVPMQIIAVESDIFVNNGRIQWLAERGRARSDLWLCFFAEPVPHAMLSRYENPDVDMFWLDELLEGAAAFVVSATPFPRNAEASIKGWPGCAIDTT